MADVSLDDVLASAEKAGSDKKKTLDELQADDRSRIAKLIVWAFVLLIAWVVAATTVGAALYDWNKLVEPAKFLMAVLGSVMLPVVTLVIGHYFGKDK